MEFVLVETVQVGDPLYLDKVKNTLSASWFYENYLDQHNFWVQQEKLKRTENEQNISMCSVQIPYSNATYLVLGSEFICRRPHLLDDRKNWRCYVGLHKIWGEFARRSHGWRCAMIFVVQQISAIVPYLTRGLLRSHVPHPNFVYLEKVLCQKRQSKTIGPQKSL